MQKDFTKVNILSNLNYYMDQLKEIKLDPLSETIMKKALNSKVGLRQLRVKHQLKNPFFTKFVKDRYNNRCAECGKEKGDIHTTSKGKEKKIFLNIHHKDYDWECPYHLTKKSKKAKGMTSTRVSDCEKCYKIDRDRFMNCVNKCVLLCDVCHYKEHWNLTRKTGSWIGRKHLP